MPASGGLPVLRSTLRVGADGGGRRRRRDRRPRRSDCWIEQHAAGCDRSRIGNPLRRAYRHCNSSGFGTLSAWRHLPPVCRLATVAMAADRSGRDRQRLSPAIRLAALSLALFPIVFYRNAYPYFYVVMIAPVSLLAGYAVTTIADYVASKERQAGNSVAGFPLVARAFLSGAATSWTLAAGQPVNSAGNYRRYPRDLSGARQLHRPLRHDLVVPQGQFLHEHVGNDAVPCGGRAGHGENCAAARPAFMITNVPALYDGHAPQGGCSKPIGSSCSAPTSRYWGPIKVAGGSAQFRQGKRPRSMCLLPPSTALNAQCSC